MQIIDIAEAEARLPELIEQVLNWEEVFISKAGRPVARLVPYTDATAIRTLGAGQWRGNVWIADDFGSLPDDLLAAFTGEAEDTENDNF